MNDEVYVQFTSTGCRHCRLKGIMQRAPPVNVTADLKLPKSVSGFEM